MNVKQRLAVILMLVIASVWALWPREVTERRRDPATGAFRDTTIQRVPLKRGLDLQGGMHLALEVDETKQAVTDESEALERALTVVRNRIDEFGVAEPVVQKVGDDRIIVELPGIDEPQRAIDLVERSAFLEFQITDESNALEKALPRIDAAIRQQGGQVAASSGAPGDTGRAGRSGALSDLFTSADTTGGADTARSDTALLGAADGAFSRLIQPGQLPGEYFVAESDLKTMERYLSLPEVRAALPPGKVVRWGTDTTSLGGQAFRAFYVLDARPIITGQYLTDARPSTDPIEGNVVLFELNNEGGRRFKMETSRHVGDYMAIVLDQRVMGRPPVIQSSIGTRGQITMRGQPLQAAQDLALVLRAGALPVPLKVIEVRQIGPSLGADSVRGGIRAAVLGVFFVVAFLIIYYRFSGVLAIGALALYGLFTLAVLAGFDAVLTLPGLAGFVLSIGMAVDANVLIFERIREELDKGRTVRAAVDGGFQQALSAIIDSNVTTALTALILYQFGTGPVRGFAVTLLAGLAASMVSAIFVVRTFYLLWLSRTRNPQTLSI